MFARYTEVLKDIMENPQTSPLLASAMSTYPLYEQKITDPEFLPIYIPTREELNKKILNHYKYREIGFETVGRFLDELQISLEEIMPYYNQLFRSADVDYNPLYNVDYERKIDTVRHTDNTDVINGSDNTTVTNNGGSNTNTSSNDNNKTTTGMSTTDKTVTSDTPQNSLSITASNIDNIAYANDVTWDKADSNSTTTSDGATTSATNNTHNDTNTTIGNNSSTRNGDGNMTEGSIEVTKGNYGQMSYQTLLLQYRDTIINVEQQIINDTRIAELFMNIY